METLQFEAGEGFSLLLELADSDAAIRGWDEDSVELTVDGSPDHCTVERQDNTLRVKSNVALSIRVPAAASVRVEQVDGDLLIRDMEGSVSLGTVHGDLSWRSGKARLSVDTVHGGLAAERVDGQLTVGESHGDVRLSRVPSSELGRVHGEVRANAVGELRMGSVSGDVRADGVSGSLSLEESHGDFRAKEILGGMTVNAVRGDLTLRGPLAPGHSYSGQAGGDVKARFPADTSARFTLEARGRILAKLPEVEEQESGRLVGRSGSGDAEVTLVAGGDLSVKVAGKAEEVEDFSADLGGTLAAQIQAEIAAAMHEAEGEISEAMRVAEEETRRGIEEAMRDVEREMPKTMREVEREISKARRRADKEAARARKRARLAQEKVAGKARKAHVKVERRARKRGARFAPEPVLFGVNQADRGPVVSEEEQLAVLRMLQDGKISAQEAEMLLQALGG
jgi:hypothetical protein